MNKFWRGLNINVIYFLFIEMQVCMLNHSNSMFVTAFFVTCDLSAGSVSMNSNFLQLSPAISYLLPHDVIQNGLRDLMNPRSTSVVNSFWPNDAIEISRDCFSQWLDAYSVAPFSLLSMVP